MPIVTDNKHVNGLEVIEEAVRLLDQIQFSANKPAYAEGNYVAVTVDPEWNEDRQSFRTHITCYAFGHRRVDWKECRIWLCCQGSEEASTKIVELDTRGQVVFDNLTPGNYGAFLAPPIAPWWERVSRSIRILIAWAQRLLTTVWEPVNCFIRTLVFWMRRLPIAVRVAAALVVFCGIAWGGTKAVKLYDKRLEEIAALRQEAERMQQRYDQAWAALHFDEVITPAVRILPVEPDSETNLLRVELSPRVDEELVQEVSVCWGDNADRWEPMYEAEGMVQRLQAVHKYILPPPGQESAWTLQVRFTVPNEVKAARRFTPDQLTSTCIIKATSKGIRFVAKTDTIMPTPQVATPARPQITWLSPPSGTEVGWMPTVTLTSAIATEKVTILVRPTSGPTFYVQSGSRPLSANVPETFVVQLGDGPQQGVGKDFDILAVCSNQFRPSESTLDMRDIPQSSVISKIVLRKAAGTLYLTAEDPAVEGAIRIKGEIYSPNGGALLAKEGKEFTVLDTLQSSPLGSSFEKVLPAQIPKGDNIYLLVYKREDPPTLNPDQKISESEVRLDLYWLYRSSKRPLK